MRSLEQYLTILRIGAAYNVEHASEEAKSSRHLHSTIPVPRLPCKRVIVSLKHRVWRVRQLGEVRKRQCNYNKKALDKACLNSRVSNVQIDQPGSAHLIEDVI